MKRIDLTKGEDFYKTWKNSIDIRNNFRMNIIDIFGEEEHGSGKGENASKYEYIVDKIKIENREYKIVLNRPTRKYNFDFYIHVYDYNFGKEGEKVRYEPRHDDIKEDLIIKKQEDIKEFERLKETIDKIYNCKNVSQKQYQSFKFKKGIPTEILLKVLKWLFLEQDVTYWNGLGRKYIYNLFNAPIISMYRRKNKIELEYKTSNKTEDFNIVGQCNNISLNEEKNYYYSNIDSVIWTKNSDNKINNMNCKVINKNIIYLKEENEIYEIKRKNNSKWIDDEEKKIILEKQDIDYIIGFDNNFYLYANKAGKKITGINGIAVKNEEFKKIMNTLKDTNCILFYRNNSTV